MPRSRRFSTVEPAQKFYRAGVFRVDFDDQRGT